MKKLLILIPLTIISCLSDLPTVPDFNFVLDTINVRSVPLEDSVKIIMNGIYQVQEGKDLLGDEIVGIVD